MDHLMVTFDMFKDEVIYQISSNAMSATSTSILVFSSFISNQELK